MSKEIHLPEGIKPTPAERLHEQLYKQLYTELNKLGAFRYVEQKPDGFTLQTRKGDIFEVKLIVKIKAI